MDGRPPSTDCRISILLGRLLSTELLLAAKRHKRPRSLERYYAVPVPESCRQGAEAAEVNDEEGDGRVVRGVDSAGSFDLRFPNMSKKSDMVGELLTRLRCSDGTGLWKLNLAHSQSERCYKHMNNAMMVHIYCYCRGHYI